MCNKNMVHLIVRIQIHRNLVVWSVVGMLKFILAVSAQLSSVEFIRSGNDKSKKTKDL